RDRVKVSGSQGISFPLRAPTDGGEARGGRRSFAGIWFGEGMGAGSQRGFTAIYSLSPKEVPYRIPWTDSGDRRRSGMAQWRTFQIATGRRGHHNRFLIEIIEGAGAAYFQAAERTRREDYADARRFSRIGLSG